jgi:O-antigen biosynthesis protein WbqP
MKRIVDVILASSAILILLVPIIAIVILVRLTSPGAAFYWSDRIGRNNQTFRMPKLRTMRIGTPSVATHLLSNPSDYLTPIGGFLRRYSIDELPQLWSILIGDMSFVGPRPALFNQDDLIAIRTSRGIHFLTPGLTGWAQINGRDEISIAEKIRLDEEYLRRRSLAFDFFILWRTLRKAITGTGVSH